MLNNDFLTFKKTAQYHTHRAFSSCNLSDHQQTLTDLAANCGIDWHKLRDRLNYNGVPVKNGIELNKGYRGKVWAIGSKWTAPDGRDYHTITFKTVKGGGYSETFDEWKETQHERDNSAFKPVRVQNPQPQPQPQPQPTKPKPEKWQVTALKQAAEAFDNASPDTVATHGYIVAKGVTIDGLDSRRGVGKYGDCLMFAIRDINGAIIGYQQIYADNIPDKNTNKHFIGSKKGGFIVIGDSAKIKESAIFCEGLATGLSIYQADGDGKTTLNNVDKTPVIVCLDAGNLSPVIEQFKDSCAYIQIYADNDTGKAHGNTGIYVALEAAKKYATGNSRGEKFIVVPVSEDGAAVDFNDTLKFEQINVAKKPLGIAIQLIKYAPTVQLNRLGKQLAHAIAKQTPIKYTVESAAQFVVDTLATRSNDCRKINPYGIINNDVKKRREAAKKRNRLIDKLGIERHDLSGLDNAQIADYIHFNQALDGKGIWLDNRSLGAGKTKLLEQLKIKFNHESIAYACHRISLVKDACNRLGVKSYHDVDPIEHPLHLGLCINSATKYRLATYRVLFIDEFRQTLEHIARGTVDNRSECLATLICAIETADLVVCSDADLNDACVAFLKKHAGGKSINLIETDSKPNPKTLHLMASHEANYQAILEELNNGGHPFVACTSKNEAKKLHTWLIESGIDAAHLLLVHSENRGNDEQAAFLENPNDLPLFNHKLEDFTHYDCVIHSPTIGSGVSIETPHFTKNFLLNSGNLPSNDALQMTARNRCANEVYVSFSSQKIYDHVTNLELLEQGEKVKGERLTDCFIPKRGGGYELTELGNLRLESQLAINEDLNDFANNFVLLAELSGYAINYEKARLEVDNTPFKGLAKRVKQQCVSNIITADIIDSETAKQIENKQAPTQADSDKLNRYKTTVMAGTPDINHQDTQHFISGAMKRLTHYETVNGTIEECRKYDTENAITENKATSKLSIHALFKISIRPLLDGEVIIGKANALAVCERLKSHAPELAANGLGNFDKPTFTRPITTLGNFIKRFGYELVQVSRTNKGVSTYRVQAMEHIARYAENRQALKADSDSNYFLSLKQN